MKDLIEVMKYAEECARIEDMKQPDHDEDPFQDGANHGVIEGKVSAYKDILKYCAKKLNERL